MCNIIHIWVRCGIPRIHFITFTQGIVLVLVLLGSTISILLFYQRFLMLMYSCIWNWRWLRLKNTWLNANTRTNGVVLITFAQCKHKILQKCSIVQNNIEKFPSKSNRFYLQRQNNTWTFRYHHFSQKLRFNNKKKKNEKFPPLITRISHLATFYCRHDI